MLRGNVLVVVTLLISGLLYIGSHSLASPSLSVAINEIAWMGTTISPDDEWIELVNNTSDAIDLTGWTLVAADGSPNITFTTSTSIEANGYFLLERSNNDSVPGIEADYIFTGSLSNTGETFELRDNNGVLVDRVDAISGWFAGDNDSKHTMARINATTEADPVNWMNSNEVGGTPRAENGVVFVEINSPPIADPGVDQAGTIDEELVFDGSASTDNDGVITEYLWDFGDGNPVIGVTTTYAFSASGDYSVLLQVTDDDGDIGVATTTVSIASNYATTSSQIVINELVSDPVTGNDEWVELYNAGTTTVDVTGWFLVEGGGSVTPLTGVIDAGSFKLVEGIVGSLNNPGDSVILKNTNGDGVDSVVYGDWDDGNTSDNAPMTVDPQSLARIADGIDTNVDSVDFKVTTKPTPTSGNVIIAPVVSSGGGGGSRTTTNTVVTKNTQSFKSSDIVINELVSDPVDSGDEWVELYNTTKSDIDLMDWTVLDGSNAVTTLLGSIKSLGYFVVEKPKGNLNNAGDRVQIKDPSGNIIDVLSYGNWNDGDPSDNAPVASDPRSLARDAQSRDTNNDKTDFFVTETVTKGKQNIITTSNTNATTTITSDLTIDKVMVGVTIKFSEVLPNPEGVDAENEFIELYNPNDIVVYLRGWKVRDESGKTFTFGDEVIAPKGFLVLEAETSKITLNNSSDQLYLFDASGSEIDSLLYEDSSEGLSYTLISGRWQWTAQPTPGKENVLVGEQELKTAAAKKLPLTIALEDIREVEIGSLVKTTGVVVVEPGILGSQYFYLAGSGAQVYSYKKDFPKLALGDQIVVTGVVSETSGERRIKIANRADIIISTTTKPVMPITLPITEIDDAHLGSLIEISGILVERKGASLVLADDSGEINIYIKSTTDIKTTEMQEGDQYKIVGILSLTKTGYRLLPRYQDDIQRVGGGEVKGVADTQDTQEEKWWQSEYAIALIIFTVAVSIIIGLKLFFVRKEKTS
jgi:hypothetical protein